MRVFGELLRFSSAFGQESGQADAEADDGHRFGDGVDADVIERRLDFVALSNAVLRVAAEDHAGQPILLAVSGGHFAAGDAVEEQFDLVGAVVDHAHRGVGSECVGVAPTEIVERAAERLDKAV